MAATKTAPKRKKKRRKQNEVTAETFLVMAKDARQQADANREGGAYHGLIRDGLQVMSGIFEREAARLRKKR